MRRRPRAPPRRRRRGSAWPGRSPLAERVPDPAHRLDEPRPAAGLGLAAQVADVDVERVRGEAEVVAPDALEDDRAGEHLARVEQEELEQVELRARELDRLAGAPRRPLAGVELDVGEAEHARAAVSAPPKERP